MSLFSFSKLRQKKEQSQLIKRELQRVSDQIQSEIEQLAPSVQTYAREMCKARGKMLRPGLVLLVAQATGGIKDDHIRFAALLEMTHMASLVHDDVLDKADTRRGEPTANKLWGNNLAVLLGDVMLAQAMMLGTEIGDLEFSRHMAYTVRELCQGEVEQSARIWDAEMTREEYFELIRKKTATLFSAAAKGSAMLQGLDEEKVAQLERIGTLLGISYQIYDDILDLSGKDEAAGKTLGTDATKGKLTLPFFYMMESDDLDVVDYIRDSVEKHEEISLKRLRESQVFYAALESSSRDAKERNAEVRDLLWELPESPAREALCELSFRLDEMIDDCLA